MRRQPINWRLFEQHNHADAHHSADPFITQSVYSPVNQTIHSINIVPEFKYCFEPSAK